MSVGWQEGLAGEEREGRERETEDWGRQMGNNQRRFDPDLGEGKCVWYSGTGLYLVYLGRPCVSSLSP